MTACLVLLVRTFATDKGACMFIRRSVIVALLVIASVAVGALPAVAATDTTPPQLVSISVAPSAVDTSASSQAVTVTAVITDDLSGVSTLNTELCSQNCLNGYDWFKRVSGDTYTATITFPQYSGGVGSIFRDWEVLLVDNAGNQTFLSVRDLYNQGFNLAFGVNAYATTYARTVHLKVTKSRASGYVNAASASNCWWYVPVILERKTASGWKHSGSVLSGWNGQFSFHITKVSKYRATAPSFGLGTPTVTTCLKASASDHV